MNHIERISAAEQQFAKEVALNVLYLRPPKMWQNLIPGMFLFDFLRRTRVVRRYTKKYMFPRRLALMAAQGFSNGTAADSVGQDTRGAINAVLQELNIDSPALAQAYQHLVDLLTGHYRRLVRAQGESCDHLILAAYPTAGEFGEHLKQLTAAENEIDQAVVEAVGAGTSLGADLRLEADQVAQRRRKVLERIYGPSG